MGRPKVISEGEVISCRNAGLSMSQIAHKLNISKGSVHKALKNNGMTGPKKLSKETDFNYEQIYKYTKLINDKKGNY